MMDYFNLFLSIGCVILAELVYLICGNILKREQGKTNFYFYEHGACKMRNRRGLGISGCALGLVYLLVYSLLVFVTICLLPDPKWEIILKMFKDSFSGMLVLFLALLAVLGILMAWSEKRYWIFTLEEVFDYYGFYEKFQGMVLLIVCYACACFFREWMGDDYIWCSHATIVFEMLSVVIFYTVMIYLLWKVLEILFSSKTEEKMLGLLYRELWHESVRCPLNQHAEQSEKEIISQNIDMLIHNHIKRFSGKIKYEEINFDTNLSEERLKALKKRITWRVFIISGALLVYINLGLLKEKNGLFCFSVLIFVAIINTWLFLRFDGFAIFMTALLFDRQGYHFKTGKNNNIVYASDRQLVNRKYVRYVKSIKSMLAYFKILLENQEDEGEEIILERIKDEVEGRNEKKRDFGLLIIAMDYLYCTKKGKHYYSEDVLKNLAEYRKFAVPFLVDMECSVSNSSVITDKYEEYFKKIDSEDVCTGGQKRKS